MPSRLSVPSRRSFLSAAGAASAFLWIPKPVKGYTAAEMRAMAVAGAVKPGVSKWELDTPRYASIRQDGEEHRDDAGGAEEVQPAEPPAREDAQCAAIAKYQLSTGSIGICCAKLGEAER